MSNKILQGRPNTDSLGPCAAELVDRMMDSDASKRIKLEDVLHTVFLRQSEDLSMSRECSMERRAISHERRTLSRDFSRERNTRERSREAVGENIRGYRTASNPPPKVRRPVKVTGRTRTDSGFASGSVGEESNGILKPIYTARRSSSRPVSNTDRVRENEYRNSSESGLPWPIDFKRCGGAKLVSAGGRYVVVNNQKVVFEMVNKNGFISKIVIVTLSENNCQQVEKRMVQKLETKGVQIIYTDSDGNGRKEDVKDCDTLARFNELRTHLLKVEEIWGKYFGEFPFSFSTSKETTQICESSFSKGGRRPLQTRNTQSEALTNRSAALDSRSKCGKRGPGTIVSSSKRIYGTFERSFARETYNSDFYKFLYNLPSSSTRLPATKRAPHSPRGGETAFRSPSPSRSPLKSPIRPIAEALREAQSPLKERRAEEMETNEATIKSESTESLFAINTSPKPKDLSLIATKIMLNIEQPEKKGEGASQQAAQQRAAAAAASIDIPEKNGEQEAVHVGEKPISNVTEGESRPRRPSKPIELENKDNEIKVEDSPAGRHRGGRRNIVVDSPLISSGRRKRHHAGADIHDDSGGEETEDKKSRRHDAKESSVASDISLYAPSSAAQSTASLSGDSRTTSCQTDIAIQGVIWTHIEKKDRRSSSNRKNSSNRTETRDTSFINLNLTKDNFTQTGRVEFDKDDQVIVTFTSEERTFIRTITIEEREKKEEEWSDDDDMSEERRLKSDGKREITVIYDTDKWLAQALAKRPGHFLDEGGSSNFGSPSKRARKEEKVKEENVQQKVVLMNMWRNVCSHRHSGIFSHPVNDKDAPGYSSTVRNRMDLQTLRKEIESGIVSTPTIMRHRLLLMYANAVMFNSTGHDVNIFAKDMAKDTLSEIMKMYFIKIFIKTNFMTNQTFRLPISRKLQVTPGEVSYQKRATLYVLCCKPTGHAFRHLSHAWLLSDSSLMVLEIFRIVVNSTTWKLIHGSCFRVSETRQSWRTVVVYWVEVLAQSSIAPTAWLFVVFLDGGYYRCLRAHNFCTMDKAKQCKNDTVLEYYTSSKSFAMMSQDGKVNITCLAAYCPHCICNMEGSDASYLDAESQIFAWFLLIGFGLATLLNILTVYLLRSVFPFQVLCCTRMCDKYTLVQRQYVETYKKEEKNKFELVAREHAAQLAEQNARAFFMQKDWSKRDWDWVSGVAEINNPMFARLRLIAAEKTKTTMYTPLQLWNDHKNIYLGESENIIGTGYHIVQPKVLAMDETQSNGVIVPEEVIHIVR
uniref:Bromo domain-containing protein n=1 Tax=Heterorhabditis bacteriophora TaxID=37862 RepID=A0A1I7WWC8_HETBA